jgi:hypothetical protein
MAITKKPKPSALPVSDTSSVDVDALINKGGSIATFKKTILETDKNKTKQIALHIPIDLFEKMETVRKSRMIKLPRHTWILEAISEKVSY